MSNILKENIGVLAGVVLGILILSAFNAIGPLLEISVLKGTQVEEVEKIPDVIYRSMSYILFYLFTIAIMIFLISSIVVNKSVNNKILKSVVTSIVFGIPFIANSELITYNIVLYLISLFAFLLSLYSGIKYGNKFRARRLS